MTLELEFTVEPFEPGSPGAHVRAAEEAAGSTGGKLTIGPFGTLLTGEQDQVLEALNRLVRRAIEGGATRVTLQLSERAHASRPVLTPAAPRRLSPAGARGQGSRFVEAVRPVVEALGGEMVASEEAEAHDVRIVWGGSVLGAVRQRGLNGALDRLLDRVSEQLGAPLSKLSREQKQLAVQLLDEQGAFNLRNSIEEAAQALQVSRFTVYNYLDRANKRPGRGEEAVRSVRRTAVPRDTQDREV